MSMCDGNGNQNQRSRAREDHKSSEGEQEQACSQTAGGPGIAICRDEQCRDFEADGVQQLLYYNIDGVI